MDMDDDYAMQDQESDPVQPENEEEEEEEVEQTQPERRTGKSRGSIYDTLDDDEEDEDEDEEEEDHRGRKRAKVGILCDMVFELIQTTFL